jgi:hypothetical protein
VIRLPIKGRLHLGVTLNADVADEPGIAGAVHDAPSGDQDIVGGRLRECDYAENYGAKHESAHVVEVEMSKSRTESSTTS